LFWKRLKPERRLVEMEMHQILLHHHWLLSLVPNHARNAKFLLSTLEHAVQCLVLTSIVRPSFVCGAAKLLQVGKIEHFPFADALTILAGEGPKSKPGDLNAIAHDHVFDCEKQPMRDEILTDSVLFPSGSEETGDFMDALFKIRKLRVLKSQMKEWSAADCKRLVMHEHFQGLLISIQQRQTKFREMFPNKPQLLKFPFFKASASVHLM
jgi:hypothetical protein